jgi:4a-hydroxytetrahydrobiopterin dehydratase
MTPTKTVLSDDELRALVQERPEWSLRDGRLVRQWTFKDFVAAIEFVKSVAAIAELAQHHPDIDIRYNRVELTLVSHDAGGITVRDAHMVRQLSAKFPA